MILNRFLGFSGRLSPSHQNIHGGFAVKASGAAASHPARSDRNPQIEPFVVEMIRSRRTFLHFNLIIFTPKDTDVDQFDHLSSFAK